MPAKAPLNQPSEKASGLASSLGAAIFSRFVLNTARRFAYPFAPVLSRGLGVPLSLIHISEPTRL